MKQTNIVPVLLGADLNCYGVARAFHEKYGVTSHAFARYSIGQTKYSRILRVTVVPDLYDNEVFLSTLCSFAKEHSGERLFLLGCTDTYAAMIIRNQKALCQYYFCPCPDAALAEKLINKASFYEMCRLYGIPYPKTVVTDSSFSEGLFENLPFSYPIIMKPASSICYWLHPFEGMKKVYRAYTPSEAMGIAKEIYGSGYDDRLIVQEFIDGNDSSMFVLTAYCDKNAKTRLLCLGHVLLEEHTPKGIGNHTAIVTEYRPDIMEKLSRFLEAVGYRGFANFDLKQDPNDGIFKVFEVNLRQGRSNYYVTGGGYNLASYPVRDSMDAFGTVMDTVKEPFFWYTVPKPIIYSYVSKEMRERLQVLVKEGKGGSTLFYPYDLRGDPRRFPYTALHHYRYFGKYRQYP